MPISAFPRMKQVRPRANPVDDVTLRDFSGGLRVTENEIALRPKYATKLVNMLPDKDTSQVLRFGTKEFATCSANIVGTKYFKQHIIAVLADGKVVKVDGAGTVTEIFNTTIAAALPGAPSGWSTGLTQADFAEFRGELVIVNGVDKPILVSSSLAVTYLQDLATSSNVNTPITKYVTTVANYLVMAGNPSAPLDVYVSNVGTSGTWEGDAAPNDGISFNVGAYSGGTSTEILAIASFKNFLQIFFENFSIAFQLGTYDSTPAHIPEPIDTYPLLGTFNHKTFVETDTDLLFASNNGMISARKNVFGGTLDTTGLSGDLGDAWPEAVGSVTAGSVGSFIAIDPLSKTLFVVFHQSDETVKAFAMRYGPKFSKQSWSVIEGWSFTGSCLSEKNRLFFYEDTKIYQYGNSVFTDENFYADYTTDGEDGNAIDFDWEFPWIDAGNRIKTKVLKNITFDTNGTSEFTLQLFVNKFYRDAENNLTPAIEFTFVAGDTGGYGNNAGGYGDNPYGGGRRANDERYFGSGMKFRIMKMRFSGSTKLPLRFVSISLIYLKGNYNV